VHLIEVGGTRVLFDSGFQHTATELLEGLHECGLGPDDIDAMFFTHSHEDHMGGAVALADVFKFKTWGWRGTVPAHDDYYAFYEQLGPWDDWLAAVLPDGDRSAFVLAASRSRPRRPFRGQGDGRLANFVGVEFGDEVQVGPMRFVCIDARGHDPYHAAWIEPDRGWVFAGDVVLDVPTPILPPLRDEFSTYADTLDRWARDLNVRRLFPGHGRSTTEVAASIARSRAWVDNVVNATGARLDAGDVDPLDIVEDIFGVPASPGELRRAIIHLGNVHSHLLELERAGKAFVDDRRRWHRGRA
jgi:glyoxylase-like metal-dependent hydrolase (beta-lactamase superfamily II)